MTPARHSPVAVAVWFVLLLTVAAAPAFAQLGAATTTISGTVFDSTGAALPAASISITATDTGVVRQTTADADGRFTMTGLPVGAYHVRATASGFAERAVDVTASLGGGPALSIVLAPAKIDSRVTVTSRPPGIDVTRTDTGRVIDERQIARLPINGRNFIDFATLTPGVAFDRGSISATSGISFAGQYARSNNISVDGVDDIDIVVGSVRTQISQEAVSEFQVIANSYAAEFGKASGGVVNIVTKAGTNRTDGSAFVFGRGAALNARGHFDQFDASGQPVDRPEGPLHQWQFGATMGGPIRANRTFYFGSVERQTAVASRFVSIDDQTIVMHPFAPVALGTPASILRAAGFTFDTGNVPYDVRSTQALGRVDHQLDTNNRLTLRLMTSVGLNENDQPFGGTVAKSQAASLDTRGWEIGGAWSRVQSARLFNDLRVHFSRVFWDELPLDPRCGGACTGDDQGGPAVNVFGVAALGRLAEAPSHSRAHKVQFIDTVSYVRGAHQAKFGVDLGYRWAAPVTFPLNRGGGFYFVDISDAVAPLFGLPHGMSAIQAFALGLPVLYLQSYGNSQLGRVTQLDTSLFAQDDWALAKRVTLKLGLRMQEQRLSSFGYQTAGVSQPFQFPGGAANLAPRLAVAWDVNGRGTTSIQAAYGRFYDNNLLGTIGISQVAQPQTGLRTLVGLGLPAIVAWSQPNHSLSEALAGPFPSLQFLVDPGLRTPFADQASIGVNHEWPGHLQASATFVSARGQHLISLIDYNPIVPALGPGRRPNDINGVAGTSASVLQFSSLARTWYSGVWFTVDKRFHGASQVMVSYTLSTSQNNVDDFSAQPSDNGLGRNPADPNGPPLGFDPLADKGPALSDQRHRLVATAIYDAPGHVHVASIVRLGSGLPYNVTAGQDLNGDGVLSNPDRPRTNPADPSTEIGRNAGRLPAQASVDVRASRAFRTGNATQLELIFDVFNLLNRVNYTDANGVFGGGAYPTQPVASFGQFTQAGPPRQAQIALRFLF
jgi:hypothetical protein